MRFILYTHSLVSDWNHGNAHFLRGVLKELNAAGHETLALEPADGWSRQNLVREQGAEAVARFATDFPGLASTAYGPDFDHEAAVDRADVVIVHEWTDPALVARLGRLRRQGAGFTLLFHDTHHRAVSDEAAIGGLDLNGYDGVLAFGETLRQRYLQRGWGQRVFTWHEAADTGLFRPHQGLLPEADLIWVGNWGDGERARELEEFLTEPAAALGLSGTVHGVRYPEAALRALDAAGFAYRGWLPSVEVPLAYARHRVTVHIPRAPYRTALPGIPTIRVFEALACGIPLVCAPWDDAEGLFSPGEDYLVARDGAAMAVHLRAVLNEPDLAAALGERGLATIRARHSCAHRVQELLSIVARIGDREIPAPSMENV